MPWFIACLLDNVLPNYDSSTILAEALRFQGTRFRAQLSFFGGVTKPAFGHPSVWLPVRKNGLPRAYCPPASEPYLRSRVCGRGTHHHSDARLSRQSSSL